MIFGYIYIILYIKNFKKPQNQAYLKNGILVGCFPNPCTSINVIKAVPNAPYRPPSYGVTAGGLGQHPTWGWFVVDLLQLCYISCK